MKELLQISHLTIYFKQKQRRAYALNDLSLTLYEGETLGIVGESGSGKSLLAKTIIGLNPKESCVIENGSIVYKGVNLLTLNDTQLRKYRGKEFAMIFQDSMVSLNPTMRVGNQVLESYLLHHKGISKEIALKKIVELFSLVKIKDPEKSFFLYPHELSGGMRQRVMIAIALAAEPKVLIADEPTTSLDVTIQAQIIDLLKEIQEKLHMSIIFITHDLSLVSHFSTHIAVMYAGKIVEYAPTKTLFKEPTHPYTERLIASIPHLNLDKNQELKPISGSPPSPLETISGCSFCPRCLLAKPICRLKSPPLISLPSGSQSACWLWHSEQNAFGDI